MTPITLPLAQAQSAPLGRGIARLPLDQMAGLGLAPGDTVALTAARKSHARLMPGPRGTSRIEVCAEMRQNIGGTWGDTAEIMPAALARLDTIVLQAEGSETPDTTTLREALFDVPLTLGDTLLITLPHGASVPVKVIALAPGDAGLMSHETLVTRAGRPDPTAQYDEIGGLRTEIARIHEMVAIPLLRPDLFDRLGVPAPRGVLFAGPPGSGKTLIARSIAARTSAAFFQINGPEIVSKHYGESEAALRTLFAEAAKNAPAIIFIDEIDAIAPRREALSGEKQVERRVVAQLLTLLDGLTERGQVIVMAATNLPNSLDPALRRPGRFDREITFRPPDPDEREEILRIHLRKAPLDDAVDLAEIAQRCHGYTGADLAALAREASLAALDRCVEEAGGEDAVAADHLFITQIDLLAGVSLTEPSALRDTLAPVPETGFADVGGLGPAKAALKEAILWPRDHAEAVRTLGLKPTVGILLSGPPGSGKSLLARAVACESGFNFLPVRPSRILSQFLGEAERSVTEIFAKARQSAPCILFFDELDALAPRRSGRDPVVDRIVAQFLTEFDGLADNTGVILLAATNRAAAIDPALIRAGRFDQVIPIDLPDQTAREAILAVHTKDRPLDGVDLVRLAQDTHGASGADLAELVNAAARHALRRFQSNGLQKPEITQADFAHAIKARALSDATRRTNHITPEAADAGT